ncbi:hypothetical protein MC885_017129 [Smutsia gigantea]|nr:hypothetical protein MC885_017129 [Smutsia gigantea]
MAKIEDKSKVLDQFMDSMQLDPETVDNLNVYGHIPPQLMEKCAALSVRPDTVQNLVQSMQGVFTDVEASLKDIRALPEEDELLDQKLQEVRLRREWAKYVEAHEKSSFTNSELHRAMNVHVGNLRLLGGPLDQVWAALPTPALSPGKPHRPIPRDKRCQAFLGRPHDPLLPPEDKAVLQNLKRMLAKVQEMRD